MAQHCDHLCSDNARGMAILVKDCSSLLHLKSKSRVLISYMQTIIRHADWVAFCQFWGLEIYICYLHGGVFHEHSALSHFECHSPVLYQPSLHFCLSMDRWMSFNTHPTMENLISFEHLHNKAKHVVLETNTHYWRCLFIVFFGLPIQMSCGTNFGACQLNVVAFHIWHISWWW